jgi:hypothetical protein
MIEYLFIDNIHPEIQAKYKKINGQKHITMKKQKHETSNKT